MKRFAILALVGLMLTGCSGVMMAPGPSRLLDQTVDLSAETAARAADGQLSPDEMADMLIYSAYIFKQIQNVRDNLPKDPLPVEPGTQPMDLLDLLPLPGDPNDG